MQKDYEWIASEKHLFGQPNTAYDFKTNNPKEAGQRLQKLQEKKEKLGRNVNMRAMNMLSEAEERVSCSYPWFFHATFFTKMRAACLLLSRHIRQKLLCCHLVFLLYICKQVHFQEDCSENG